MDLLAFMNKQNIRSLLKMHTKLCLNTKGSIKWRKF